MTWADGVVSLRLIRCLPRLVCLRRSLRHGGWNGRLWNGRLRRGQGRRRPSAGRHSRRRVPGRGRWTRQPSSSCRQAGAPVLVAGPSLCAMPLSIAGPVCYPGEGQGGSAGRAGRTAVPAPSQGTGAAGAGGPARTPGQGAPCRPASGWRAWSALAAAQGLYSKLIRMLDA